MTAEFYALKGMFLAQINKYVLQYPSHPLYSVTLFSPFSIGVFCSGHAVLGLCKWCPNVIDVLLH